MNDVCFKINIVYLLKYKNFDLLKVDFTVIHFSQITTLRSSFVPILFSFTLFTLISKEQLDKATFLRMNLLFRQYISPTYDSCSYVKRHYNSYYSKFIVFHNDILTKSVVT